MAKIQYNNKVVRTNTPPTPEEIFSATDANEIKASVNFLYDNAPEPFEIEQYSSTKTYKNGDVAYFGDDNERYLIQSNADNNLGTYSTESPRIEANATAPTFLNGVIFPNVDDEIEYDANLEAFYPPEFYGMPEIVRVQLKADDGRVAGFYTENISFLAQTATEFITLTVKETAISTLNTTFIITKDFLQGDAYVFYQATNGESFRITVKQDDPNQIIDLSMPILGSQWVNLGVNQDDLNGFIKNLGRAEQPQKASISIDGLMSISGKNDLGENSNLQIYSHQFVMQSGSMGFVFSPNGFQGGGIGSTLTWNANVISGGANGNSYTLVPAALVLNYQGKSKTLEVNPSDSIGTVTNYFPNRNGVLATLDDLPAPIDTSNFATRNELTSKTNKTESFENNGSLTYFTANINDGFLIQKSNDQYDGNVSTLQTVRSFQVSTEKPMVGSGDLNRGTSLQLAHYGDGLLFNQYTTSKTNSFRLRMPIYNTTVDTNAIVTYPPMVEDGTVMVLSNNQNPPASQTAPGVKGEVRIIGNFKYECTGTNNWVRTPIQGVW